MSGSTGGSGNFGSLLRRRRIAAGLTQEELAERTGLSVRAISNMERGITGQPRRSTVSAIAGTLDLGEPSGAAPGRADEGQPSAVAGPDQAMPDQAMAPGRAVPRQLPAALPSFVGRAAELRMLTGLLDHLNDPPGTVVISVIGGTAGVGKTALAVRWAHLVAARFPDGQLYIDLRGFGPSSSRVMPMDALRGFLDALGVPAASVPAQPDAQVGLYRSLLAGKRMLIMLDNAGDAGQVTALLPGGSGCLVLITSRNQMTGLAVASGAHRMILDVFSRAEALDLLALGAGAMRAGREPEAMEQLTELTARLPLALSIAAARAAAHPAHPLAALAAELRDTRDRLDALDGGEPSASVRAAFSWSYRQLPPAAAHLFRVLGLHPGPDVSGAAAASLAGLQPRPARRLLAELDRAHLLTEHVPGRYACHDLLRVYAGEQAHEHDDRADREAALHRMLDHYLHTAFRAAMLLNPARSPIALPPARPGTSPERITTHAEALAWFEAEYQVLLNVVPLAADNRAEASSDSHAWQLPWTMVNFSDRRGRWDDVATMQRLALAAASRLADLTGQARAHFNIGGAYLRTGRYDDALTHLRGSLAIFTQIGDHTSAGHSLLAIAEIFRRQGRYRLTLEHAEQALAVFRSIGQQAGQAFALTALSEAHLNLRDDQQVVAYCDQALAMHRQLGDRFGQAESWDSLGQANTRLGRYATAIDCFRYALGLVRELGDRYNQASVENHLGDAYHAAGDDGAAVDAWRRSLVILEELHHGDSGSVAVKIQRAGRLPWPPPTGGGRHENPVAGARPGWADFAGDLAQRTARRP